MKILNADQIRQADAHTIANEPIASIDLMERAANRCFDWICENLDTEEAGFHIFCGIGNNGGDGLVIARLLSEKDLNVNVYVLRFSPNASLDFNTNYERLDRSRVNIVDLHDASFNLPTGPKDLIIDAIFGTGLNKPIQGWLKDVIVKINLSHVMRLSVDIPSGLFSEFNDGNDMDAIVQADITLTFQRPKLSFVLEESGAYCGQWEILDIGLDEDFLENQASSHHIIDEHWVWARMKERGKFDHKGDFGHALIISGSKGKVGAAVLATRAALRSGIGLLTVFTPLCGYNILQMSVPEAMCITSNDIEELDDLNFTLSPYNVIGVGPGIGTGKHVRFMFHKLLESHKGPMVLDADALNLLSDNPKLLSLLPKHSILTPHPGEFGRMAGTWSSDKERLKKQLDYSKQHKAYVLLKGAHTTITTPDGEAYFNTTGNPGMATAGSGDVLLGVITALLGRGYSPIEAAGMGAYIHGLAGDVASIEYGEESMKAGDIIDAIPEAMKSIQW